MSTKATASSRKATKALAEHNRTAQMARAAANATRLTEDAKKAAIAAACAAERARISDGTHTTSTVSDIFEIESRVRKATEEAIRHASDAMKAESTGDIVDAIHSANLAANAARRAASLATVASVIGGMAQEMASESQPEVPEISVKDRRTAKPTDRRSDTLSAAINHNSNYLVTYDGKIIATFDREEDAFLFESELADLDKTHDVSSGKCEVIERRTGKRLGGYLLAGGKMIVFLRDHDQKRFGGSKRTRF